jgi:hypothetical protein
MISIRHDLTADTYRPLPITDEDLRLLQEAFRDHAPDVELDRGATDEGVPYISVTDPDDGFPPCITRGEVKGPDGASKLGWQLVRGEEGPAV